ncbi:MAG: hypothetical protein J5898_03620 [Lachnospiraceae bacterium]|nr:hypothetical protein [Lachnospiraceae bacterium]
MKAPAFLMVHPGKYTRVVPYLNPYGDPSGVDQTGHETELVTEIAGSQGHELELAAATAGSQGHELELVTKKEAFSLSVFLKKNGFE